MSNTDKIRCAQALKRLFVYLDKDLSGTLQQQLEQHMESCRSRYSRLEFEQTLKSHPGDTVLDIGSGAGTDTLISANKVGSEGKVYGLDMTRAMQEKLVRNIEIMGIEHVAALSGNAEKIPLPDASIDVITSNGVINLVPDKPQAIREMFRVLRPGGRIQITDIVIGVNQDTLTEARENPRLWAECIAGAVTEPGYFDMFEDAGFTRPEKLNTFDYFSASSKHVKSPPVSRPTAFYSAPPDPPANTEKTIDP